MWYVTELLMGLKPLDSVCFKYGAIHFAGSSPLGTWHVGFTTARYSTPFFDLVAGSWVWRLGSVVKDMEWLGLLPRVRQLKVMDADVIFFKFWCGMKRKSMEIHKYKQTPPNGKISQCPPKRWPIFVNLYWFDLQNLQLIFPVLQQNQLFWLRLIYSHAYVPKQILQASGPYLTSSINQVLKLYSYRPSLIWIQDGLSTRHVAASMQQSKCPKMSSKFMAVQ